MVIHHIDPNDGGEEILETLGFKSTVARLIVREDFSTHIAVIICSMYCIPYWRRRTFLADHSGRAGNVFARSSNGIMGWNSTRGINVSLRFFCVCVVLFR
jgi:hypothetical protein